MKDADKTLRRGSVATSKDGNCDLIKLCETYQNVGNVPERLGWARACEIALLAQTVLPLLKDEKLWKKS